MTRNTLHCLKRLFACGVAGLILLPLLACATAPTTAPAPAPSPAPTPAPAPSPAPNPTPAPAPPPVVNVPPPAATQPPASTTTPVPAPAPAAYSVKTASKAGIGDYLVDASGMTLYYFASDSIGNSNATGAILIDWPIFYVDSFAVPAPLNAADFGAITRGDGQRQATYKGWPLYYYAKDQSPGDTTGQGVGNVWFVINPDSFPPQPQAPATGGGDY